MKHHAREGVTETNEGKIGGEEKVSGARKGKSILTQFFSAKP